MVKIKSCLELIKYICFEFFSGRLSQLMETLDVFISVKPKPKQPSKVSRYVVCQFVYSKLLNSCGGIFSKNLSCIACGLRTRAAQAYHDQNLESSLGVV